MPRKHPQDPWPKPRFLMQGSPLVEGGKARLLSAKKVTPKRAEPREVTEIEEHGYTELPARAMDLDAETLDEQQWRDHVLVRVDTTERQRKLYEERAREQARRLMDFETRLATAHDEARKRCIDVSSEVRLVRHMQSRGREVRHLEQRLFGIERKVWPRVLEDAA